MNQMKNSYDDLVLRFEEKNSEIAKDLGDLRSSTEDLSATTKKQKADIDQLRLNTDAKVKHLEHELAHLDSHICGEKAENARFLLSKAAFGDWTEAHLEETERRTQE